MACLGCGGLHTTLVIGGKSWVPVCASSYIHFYTAMNTKNVDPLRLKRLRAPRRSHSTTTLGGQAACFQWIIRSLIPCITLPDCAHQAIVAELVQKLIWRRTGVCWREKMKNCSFVIGNWRGGNSKWKTNDLQSC